MFPLRLCFHRLRYSFICILWTLYVLWSPSYIFTFVTLQPFPMFPAVRICSAILTQPGTPVSFQGMLFICLFNFQKLWTFRCFPISGNSGALTFPISRKLQTPMFSDISHSFMYFTFHLWFCSLPLFHVIVLTYVLRSPSLYPVQTCPTP